jgi:hypothetical protein
MFISLYRLVNNCTKLGTFTIFIVCEHHILMYNAAFSFNCILKDLVQKYKHLFKHLLESKETVMLMITRCIAHCELHHKQNYSNIL